MRYSDSVKKSAELLKRAVPMMSRQAAGLHPVSYALWYEYVSGHNAALRSDIDGLIKCGTVLDEKSTAELFRKHISEIDEQAVWRVAPVFQKIIEDVSRSTSRTEAEVDQFGHALEKLSAGLSESQLDVARDADVLLKHTQAMRQSVISLQRRLQESEREIEQLRREVSKAREESRCDSLSGLTNRKGFDAALEECLVARGEPDEPGPSLLILDIDFFKRVNDSYGHPFGDRVIQAVAEILKKLVKGQDTAARIGGEEFVVLLPNTALEGAHHLAEKIRMTVEKLRIRRIDNQDVVANITISLGVASYRQGESAGDFLMRADRALYASKREGRNRSTVADVVPA
jgi:diguanylate cyclase